MTTEAPKIVWRVDPVPSDDSTPRGWPGATYETAEGEVAATIEDTKATPYTPDNAKSEKMQLVVRVLNHTTGNYMRVARIITSLTEAKTVAAKVITDHPEFWPSRFQSGE